MSVLTGHAVRIDPQGKIADHTYVTSSDGKAWGCWGRSTGGRVIVSGPGSSAAANCISYPFSWANIVYGVTGVCHQTSNRILMPAKRHVWRAHGAVATYILYGMLGTDMPIFLIKAGICAAKASKAKRVAPLMATLGESVGAGDDEETSLIQDVISLHEKAMPDLYKKLAHKELSYKTLSHEEIESEATAMRPSVDVAPDIMAGETNILVKHRLGGGYDTIKVDQLVGLRSALSKDTEDCSASIIAADSSADTLAQKMNDEIGKTLVSMKDLLGEGDYKKFLGHHDTDIRIVDPEILAESFESRPKV